MWVWVARRVLGWRGFSCLAWSAEFVCFDRVMSLGIWMPMGELMDLGLEDAELLQKLEACIFLICVCTLEYGLMMLSLFSLPTWLFTWTSFRCLLNNVSCTKSAAKTLAALANN